MGVGIPPCSGRCRPFLADAARESVTGLYDELRGFAVNGAHLPPKFGVDVLTIVRNIGFGFACWAYL